MTDRDARDTLAEQIRYFMSCLTDSFQFDDAIFDINTQDTAVITIREQMWHTYDDIMRHKLNGKKALSKIDQDTVKRFILFLKTDLDIASPSVIQTNPLWPFSNREEYESSLNNPVYLNS